QTALAASFDAFHAASPHESTFFPPTLTPASQLASSTAFSRRCQKTACYVAGAQGNRSRRSGAENSNGIASLDRTLPRSFDFDLQLFPAPSDHIRTLEAE